MSIPTRFLFLFMLSGLAAGLSSQSFPGLSTDNFGGVNTLLLNPANAAANRVGFEIHLASASLGVANDYVGLEGYEDIDNLDWGNGLSRHPSDDNRLYTDVDVLGPSLLIGLGKKAGLGLVSRVRTVYDIEGFDGRLLEGLEDSFDELGDYTATLRDHRSGLHSWGELAAVLGVVLFDNGTSTLKAGGAVKSLRGVGSVYTRSTSLDVEYDGSRERLTTRGDFTYGTTGDFDFEDAELDDQLSYLTEPAGTGLGFDVGLAFEWRSEAPKPGRAYQPYRLRLGLSLTDVGSISYDGGEEAAYVADAVIPTDDIEGEDLVDVLDRYYDGTYSDGPGNFQLPTALNLQADVRLAGKLYVAALARTPMGGSDGDPGSTVQTTLTVVPRLETKWLSLYAPARFGGVEGTTVGAGLRLGFFTLGSTSVLSHLLTDTNYSVDVYAGVKVPFYRRSRLKEPLPEAEGIESPVTKNF
ncbi:DUF5723 family protein [Lewinella sp. IMCC34183]|uniref:DUF5723 family protein n=1 Tax=Lewinella sp. IMCC34183 TaxID=2248762 RepID=UPI000E259F12|nr:DUF5723 family protein [Lewinella sp. IMCC34183]